MATRNFYINADIDGRATNLTGGPAGKTSGMSVTITQRDDSSIKTACVIDAQAYENGRLELKIFDKEGKCIYINETFR